MELGIFKSVWDGQPNHLPLLNLYEMDQEQAEFNLTQSITKLDFILTSNSPRSIQESIMFLLESVDWRPHLVATLSFLALRPSERGGLLPLFWGVLSRGTWVSPQILVALSVSDSEFKIKGERILVEGFKINYPRLSPVDHHVSRGGTPSTVSERKIIAAVDFLLNGVVKDTADNDAGGSIAKNWKERLEELVAQNKFKLGQY